MTATRDAAGDAAVSRQANDGSPASSDVAALRDEIAQTRTELGETVQALAAKADVKARLQSKADETRARVRERAGDARAKVRESMHAVTAKAEAAATESPEKAQELATRGGVAVRRNPVPIAVAFCAVVAVIVFLQWRRRSR